MHRLRMSQSRTIYIYIYYLIPPSISLGSALERKRMRERSEQREKESGKKREGKLKQEKEIKGKFNTPDIYMYIVFVPFNFSEFMKKARFIHCLGSLIHCRKTVVHDNPLSDEIITTFFILYFYMKKSFQSVVFLLQNNDITIHLSFQPR